MDKQIDRRRERERENKKDESQRERGGRKRYLKKTKSEGIQKKKERKRES